MRRGRRAAAVLALALALAGCSGDDGPAPAATDQGIRFIAFVTGYTYYTNTPPGSAKVSHPILHRTAGGVGTFQDPVTMAVGHSRASGRSVLDFEAGTKFYLPHVGKYFIVEDTCGDGPQPENGPCHTGYEAPAEAWLDIWVNGEGQGAERAAECARRITGNHEVIQNPSMGHPVTPGSICD